MMANKKKWMITIGQIYTDKQMNLCASISQKQ